jgi:antitoxin HigA-1
VTAEAVMAPVHPGEILLEEFLKPLGVSQYQLAKAVSVSDRRINEIVHAQRRISADAAGAGDCWRDSYRLQCSHEQARGHTR